MLEYKYMENLHIFICHYNPLTERKKYILDELNIKIGNLLIKELECEFDSNVKEYKYEGFDENKTINYVYFIRKYDRQYLTKEIKDSMFLSCHDNKNNIRLEYSSVNNYQSNIVTYENFESKYNLALKKGFLAFFLLDLNCNMLVFSPLNSFFASSNGRENFFFSASSSEFRYGDKIRVDILLPPFFPK